MKSFHFKEISTKFFVFVVILSLIVFSIPYSGVSSDNLINTKVSNSSFKTRKFICAYDFNEVDIPFIASHFDILDTYLNKAPQVQKIKNLNPLFRAIFYEDALTHSEGSTKDWKDWYVHDAQTGSRLVNKDWGWYLMDIGKESYRISLANHIRDNLASNQVFDGVFLDDVSGSVSSQDFYRAGTKETGIIPQSVIDSWDNNMKILIAKVKMAIRNKLLIINTDYYKTDYIVFSDGLSYEAFGHANWQAYGKYYPDWQKVLNRMILATNSGKIYLAQSGIQKTATDLETSKTARYCFAMFLLGSTNKSYFYFSKNYRGVTYFPEWDVDIGTPFGGYRARTGTPLYEREYSKGLVLINPSSESVQINLGTEYKTLDGVITDKITMGDHQGEILMKHLEERVLGLRE